MNRISIRKDGQTLKDYILDHGSVTIGRAKDNMIQLHDETISAHHARIITIFTASHIEDLGSTNGTFVNHRKVVKHTLHSDDIITIGGTQIVFYTDENKDPLAEPANQGNVLPDATEVIGDSKTARIDEAGVTDLESGNGPDTVFNAEQAKQPLYTENSPAVASTDQSSTAKRNLILAAVITVILIAILYALLD